MYKRQLLGATGTGKTFTIANVIQQTGRPALVLAHNKTLAAQLCNELREFFPKNAVEYFISYYDYYQPEAYVPVSDTYIAKTASINEEIDMLRHSATRSLFERKDVIVVASISCIYGLGIPSEYLKAAVKFEVGKSINLRSSLRSLVENQYTRNDIEITRGRFRIKGDVLEIGPAYEDRLIRIELFGDEVEAIKKLVKGVNTGKEFQTLLGATGTGKTFTIANVIQQTGRPALVLAHNKTLAAQLCNELREFFPKNAVEYFISYYDYCLLYTSPSPRD